jgi:DNA repair exonuclease SbcCD ATPase subunit
MKINTLRLENIRSYRDETVDFPDGVTLVHGENGAGKTTLLMGIFGGLFLSGIRNVGTNSFALDDLVRRGETKGVVELAFEAGGDEYTVEWTLYTTSTANTATLTSEALPETIDGIQNVRRAVHDLLGMDEDDFASSVYVKQGEVDRLIEAGDRAAMIDGLLGLDEIDDYVEAAEKARLGVKRVHREAATLADSRRSELDGYEYDEEGYEDALREVESAVDEAKRQKQDVTEYLDDLQGGLASLTSRIEGYEEDVDALKRKKEKIQSVESKRSGEQEQIQKEKDRIDDLREKRADVEERIEEEAGDLDAEVGTADAAGDALETLRDDMQSATNEKTRCEGELERAEDALETLTERRSERKAELDETTEERAALEDTIGQKTSELERDREALWEAARAAHERCVDFLPDEESLPDPPPALPTGDTGEALPPPLGDKTREAVQGQVDSLRETRETAAETRAEATATRRERKQDLNEASERRDELKDTLDEKRSAVEAAEARVRDAEERLSAVREKANQQAEALARKAGELDVQADASDLESAAAHALPDRLDTLSDSRAEAERRIASLEQKREQVRDDADELRELEAEGQCPRCRQPVDRAHIDGELDALRKRADALEADLAEAREHAAALDETREALTALRGEIQDLIEYRNDTVADAEEALQEARQQVEEQARAASEVEEEIQACSERVEALEEAIEGLDETVESAGARVDALDERVESGRGLLDRLQELRDEAARLDRRADEVRRLRERREELKETIEDKREQIETLDTRIENGHDVIAERREALETARERVEALKDDVKALRSIVRRYDRIGDLQTRIGELNRSIKHRRRTVEEYNDRLDDLRSEREALEEKLGEADVETMRDKREQVRTRIEERKQTRAELDERLGTLQDRRARLDDALTKLRDLKARIETIESKARWAKNLWDELDAVREVYEGVKSELRERYLAYINRYTNDVFEDVYLNTSYQRIEVSETYDERAERYDYDIQLVRDDGKREAPSNASGGERAIVNLALRAGIYRLIAEIEGGDGRRLPPFILDEPTTFLDESHVGQLEQMLERIRGWDVPQVIVVSHNRALIHGADHECRVEAGPAGTSRATVEAVGKSHATDGEVRGAEVGMGNAE